MSTLLLCLAVVGAATALIARSNRRELATTVPATPRAPQPPGPVRGPATQVIDPATGAAIDDSWVWVLPGKVVRPNAPMWRRIIALPLLLVIFLGLGLILTAIIGGLLAGSAVLLQEVLS